MQRLTNIHTREFLLLVVECVNSFNSLIVQSQLSAASSRNWGSLMGIMGCNMSWPLYERRYW